LIGLQACIMVLQHDLRVREMPQVTYGTRYGQIRNV
jgi:hypothetical protein